MAVIACFRSLGDYGSMPIPGLDSEFDDHWTVECNSTTDNAATIYATGCLPARYTSFPDNIFATLRRVGLHRERQAPKFWRATLHYSSVPLTQQEQQQAQHENPLNRDAEIDWDATAYQTPVTCSIDGKAIINSAGDQTDTIPEKTDYHWVATVQKNVMEIPAWAIDYCGKINDSTFLIDGLAVDAQCARLVTLKLSRKRTEGIYTYRQLTMGLEFRARRTVDNPGTWPPPPQPGQDADRPLTYLPYQYSPPPFHLELPDMGLYEDRDYPNGQRVRIKTDSASGAAAQPVVTAVMLDGLGMKEPSPNMVNSRVMAWQLHETRNFSLLPLS